jgi:hypothetical protein
MIGNQAHVTKELKIVSLCPWSFVILVCYQILQDNNMQMMIELNIFISLMSCVNSIAV